MFYYSREGLDAVLREIWRTTSNSQQLLSQVLHILLTSTDSVDTNLCCQIPPVDFFYAVYNDDWHHESILKNVVSELVCQRWDVHESRSVRARNCPMNPSPRSGFGVKLCGKAWNVVEEIILWIPHCAALMTSKENILLHADKNHTNQNYDKRNIRNIMLGKKESKSNSVSESNFDVFC